METNKYLQAGFFTDSDHPKIKKFAQKHYNSDDSDIMRAVKLYYAVRDGFFYNPYCLDLKRSALKASRILDNKQSYCVEKAIVLTAAYRAAGLPSRLGFAIVKNHIGTERLERFLQTDLLVFHGYTEVYLNKQWVKATPAFNKALCDKLGVLPLEFDGKTDSVLQEYDRSGAQYMEYVHFYGNFHDLPYDLFISELKKYYPRLFESQYYDAEHQKVCFTE
jgi:transglutaminase-like putative cysteine protease